MLFSKLTFISTEVWLAYDVRRLMSAATSRLPLCQVQGSALLNMYDGVGGEGVSVTPREAVQVLPSRTYIRLSGRGVAATCAHKSGQRTVRRLPCSFPPWCVGRRRAAGPQHFDPAWDSILVSNSYRLHWFLQTGTWPGLRRRTSLHRGVSARDRHSYNLAVEQLQPTGRRLLGDVLALSLSGPLPPSMKVVLIHNGRCCVLCRWDKPSESPTSTHSFPY